MRKSKVLLTAAELRREFDKCCSKYPSLHIAVAWCGNPQHVFPFDSLNRFEGKVTATLGYSFDHTHPDAFKWFINKNAKLRIFDDRNRGELGLFHPKIYLFENGESFAAIIGSSNLTSGGFQTNVESNVLIYGDKLSGQPDILALKATLIKWRTKEFSFKPDNAWITQYKQRYKANRPTTRPQKLKNPVDYEEIIGSGSWLSVSDWKTFYKRVLDGTKHNRCSVDDYHQVLNAAEMVLGNKLERKVFLDVQARNIFTGQKGVYDWLGNVGANGRFKGFIANGPGHALGAMCTHINALADKPVLLLAVIQGMEEGWVAENRIELSPELVGAFKGIWGGLVTTGHSPLIAQPFFHMRGEKFWHHVPNPGYENWGSATKSCKCIGVLHRAVDYVQLDPELFMLMMSPAHREILKHTLYESYFPSASIQPSDSASYLNSVTDQILSESSAAYQTELERMRESLDKESYEEEVFVRGGVFKRQIPIIYNNTCCISGLRVETSINASLIDACHIVPFSQSHDDTITNGMALCPNLHRAFDRGLVAIDPDNYTVMISKRLSEPVTSTYSIRQFEGQEINRPENRRYHPGKENLHKHLERFAENFW